jgi:PST family polysaccharide transporter
VEGKIQPESEKITSIPINADGPEGSLMQSAVRGFGWNLTGSVVRHGAGFLINIILARLLGPEPFGIVALATIVISIGNLVVDSGLNASLVQKKELKPCDIKYVFTIQILLGISFYLLIVLSAPLIAKLFKEAEIIPVLRVLSLMIVLQAASQTSMGLLKRNLMFKRIQQAVLVSYLLGYLLLGLPLAFAGKGVWSLVTAQLVQSFIFLIVVYLSARHPIAFSFRDENKVTRFGINILGANIANWIISYLDTVIIGRWFGSEVLGLYNRSMALAYTPVNIIVTSTQTVIFTATSRAQDAIKKVRISFLGVFSMFAFIFFPLSFFISLTADVFILTLYGSKWVEAIPILRILSLSIPFFALMAIEGPLLAGLGKPEIELKRQWVTAIIAIVAFLIAVQFSLSVVLWTVFGIYVIRFILMTSPIIDHLKLNWQELGELLLFSGIVTALVSLVTIINNNLFKSLPDILVLIILSGLALLTWIGTLGAMKHIFDTSVIFSNITDISKKFFIKFSNKA